MASEVKILAKTSNIVTDLGSVNSSYSEAIIYDDKDRTSGNVFIFRTSGIVNNGTVYAASGSGVWEMQYNSAINVKWFGAAGSGLIDDYLAIASALAFASGAKNELYFPPGNYAVSAALSLSNNLHISGHERTSVTIKPYTGYTGGSINAAVKSNIVIDNLTFDGFQSDMDVNNITYITFNNVAMTNIGTLPAKVRGIYIRSSSNVTVQNCYIDNVSGMGIAVEGGSPSGVYKNILITGNIVKNVGDNGIAVRAINGSLTQTMVSNNEIYNAGKAGIKNTIEADSKDDLTFTNAVISDNLIYGWGTQVAEAGISVSSYNATSIIENCSVVGNVIKSNNYSESDNFNQIHYINGVRLNMGTITANSGTGGCALSGIQISNANDVVVTGNVIDASCKNDDSGTPISAGILANISNNINMDGNISKNNGSENIPRPGISLRKAEYCIVTDNICYDDQTQSSQSYGIEESSSGGFPDWSANNYFATNIAYGNISGNFLITNRSKFIDFNKMAASADTASAVGATYSQTQVQGILNELRDLKTKMRASGILAT